MEAQVSSSNSGAALLGPSFTSTAAVVVVAALAVILPFLVIGELPGEQWLASQQDQTFLFGAVGVGLLALDALLPVPSSITVALMGARLGFVPGWLSASGGLVIGNMVAYLLGRLWSPKGDIAGDESAESMPLIWVVALTRCVPIVAETVSVVAGRSGLAAKRMLVGSVIGNLGFAGAHAYAGARLVPANGLVIGLLAPLALSAVALVAWNRLAGRAWLAT